MFWKKGKPWVGVDAIMGREEELEEYGETGMGEEIFRDWERTAGWIETMYFGEVRGSECDNDEKRHKVDKDGGFWKMTSREIEMHPDNRPLRLPGMGDGRSRKGNNSSRGGGGG